MNPSPSPASPRTIAVTGASGFVGRSVVRELSGRGYAVRGLVRDIGDAREAFGTTPANVELVAGDICDDAVLGRLVKGAGACIHLVGIIREVRGKDRPQTFERMHISGTRHVVDACRSAGVKRYLHMSALGSSADGRAEYQRTKWEAERYVRRALGEGEALDWTIFRPSLIHGPDGEFVQLIADMVSGEVPPFFFLPYFGRMRVDHRVPAGTIDWVPPKIQPVAVEDVALAFAEALTREESIGEIYNLVGPDLMTWPQMLEFFRDTLPGANRRLQPFYVPSEHAAAIATVAKTLGLGSLLPFDRGQALMGAEDSTGELSKARTHLGLVPRGFRETVRTYAGAV